MVICEFKDCEKQAVFGNPSEKAMYCAIHKEDSMIDVVSKRCTSCKLFQAKKRTNYLCIYCNPEKSNNRKSKENIVKEFLESNNFDFVHNKQIINDCCLKYRPDFLFDCGSYFVVLECDENEHSGYEKDCEIIRMNNISSGNRLPTLFIRYNPDLKGIRQKKKHSKLLETLNTCLNFEMLLDPTPRYLFYSK